MKKDYLLAIALVTVFAHYILYSQTKISALQNNIDLANTALSIEEESVRDLIYANTLLAQEKESIAAKSYVSGIVNSIKSEDHDHYNKIWHDGYDRGSEVQLENISKDKAIAKN